MSRKKQIIIPVLVLAAGVAMFAAFSSMKKPPEEKEKVDNTPIVAVEQVSLSLMVMEVESYGIVKPKYETELVAQVSGQIVDISDTFVRGGFVKQGQLLARIDPNDYQAALIEAEATLASASASLETERAQGKVAADEWLRIKNSTPSELSLRKPQLAQELARVKAAQAAVKRAKRNLERTAIVAPYDAMIDVRHIGLGSFVSTGAPIGKLLGTNEAELRLPVADNQLQFLLDQGKQAQVILTGEFAGISTEWQASITRDEGVIDGTSRMSYLVAHIADPYALHSQETPLRFGSYVNARIQGMQVASAAIVPRHLVVDGKVAVLDTDSKLRYLPITIVRHTGADVVVSSGLAQGDQVIVSALDYPVDGMKLALLTEDEPDVKPDSVADTQIASASIKD